MKNINEFKRLNITRKDLEKSNNIVLYRINGKVYKFAIPDSEIKEETPFAYCVTLNKWAWLYPKHVFFKNEFVLQAERI